MKGLNLVNYDEKYVGKFSVDSSNATAIFKNGGVIAVADGNVDGWDGSNSAAFLGVVIEVRNSDGIETSYLPASTAGEVTVVYDPHMLISVEAATGIAEADRFGSADLASNAGNTTTGESTAQISSTIAADDQFFIVGLDERVGNTWAAANGNTDNTQVIVMPRIQIFKDSTALAS